MNNILICSCGQKFTCAHYGHECYVKLCLCSWEGQWLPPLVEHTCSKQQPVPKDFISRAVLKVVAKVHCWVVDLCC